MPISAVFSPQQGRRCVPNPDSIRCMPAMRILIRPTLAKAPQRWTKSLQATALGISGSQRRMKSNRTNIDAAKPRKPSNELGPRHVSHTWVFCYIPVPAYAAATESRKVSTSPRSFSAYSATSSAPRKTTSDPSSVSRAEVTTISISDLANFVCSTACTTL